uniref:Os01g0778700 protein n=1 Tax=Macrostomum lignano TaxID=282301 RepID=A0A1I8G7I3_9PLAT
AGPPPPPQPLNRQGSCRSSCSSSRNRCQRHRGHRRSERDCPTPVKARLGDSAYQTKENSADMPPRAAGKWPQSVTAAPTAAAAAVTAPVAMLSIIEDDGGAPQAKAWPLTATAGHASRSRSAPFAASIARLPLLLPIPATAAAWCLPTLKKNSKFKYNAPNQASPTLSDQASPPKPDQASPPLSGSATPAASAASASSWVAPNSAGRERHSLASGSTPLASCRSAASSCTQVAQWPRTRASAASAF